MPFIMSCACCLFRSISFATPQGDVLVVWSCDHISVPQCDILELRASARGCFWLLESTQLQGLLRRYSPQNAHASLSLHDFVVLPSLCCTLQASSLFAGLHDSLDLINPVSLFTFSSALHGAPEKGLSSCDVRHLVHIFYTVM